MVAREARQTESASPQREMHGIASHDSEAGEEATDGVFFLVSHRHVHASHVLLHMSATFSFLQRWCGVLRWTVWTTYMHAELKSLIIRLLCPTQAHPCRKSFPIFWNIFVWKNSVHRKPCSEIGRAH